MLLLLLMLMLMLMLMLPLPLPRACDLAPLTAGRCLMAHLEKERVVRAACVAIRNLVARR